MKALSHPLKTLCALATLCLPVYANAMLVFDPTNLVQNYTSAIAAVKNEVNTAAQYVQQIKQTYELVKSTATIQGLTKLAGLEEEYKTYQDLMATEQQIQSTMQAGLNMTRDLQAQMGASNFSWKTFLENRNGINTSRADAFKAQFDQMNKTLVTTAERRKTLLQTLDAAQGQSQATQAVGAQIDVLIGQQQQMIAVMAQQKQEEEFKIRQNQAEVAAANAYNDKVQKGYVDSSSRFNTYTPK